MEVYLIPTTTSGRYELYYEAPDEEVVDEADEGGLINRVTFGMANRLKRRFSAMLLEAEEWRHRRHEAQPEDAGMLVRLRRKAMGFIVERIAEQRLLWHLRKATEVCACIPADLPPSGADAIIRAMLKTDHDRHRKWLLIDFALLIPSAALTIVPGPNVLGLYFTFQVVSHYLSWSGARTGLAISPWTFKPSEDLAALRAAMTLTHVQRQRTFREIAARLRLEHLPTFLDDVAAPPA
jgi:K+-H+ exchange-related protein